MSDIQMIVQCFCGSVVIWREHRVGGKELVSNPVTSPFAQQIGQATHFLYFLILAFKHCDNNNDNNKKNIFLSGVIIRI